MPQRGATVQNKGVRVGVLLGISLVSAFLVALIGSAVITLPIAWIPFLGPFLQGLVFWVLFVITFIIVLVIGAVISAA